MGLFKRKVADWLGSELGTVAAGASMGSAAQVGFMQMAQRVMANYVTSAVQMCEFKFYEGGEPTAVSDGYFLWNLSPNPNQSRAQFLSALLERVLVNPGRALVVPVRSGGRTRLYVADSYTRTVVAGAADLFSNIVVEGSSKVVPHAMSADEVMFFDVSGIGGAWSDLMAQVRAKYDEMLDIVLKATADRNGRKWLLGLDQPFTGDPEQVAKVTKMVEETYRPFIESTTGVVPLFSGQKLERASLDSGRFSGMNAKDIANIRTDMFNMVAASFRMPSSMLTGNASNFDSVFNSFLTTAVDPVARMLSEEITRKCFGPAEWRAGSRCAVDTHHIKHIDLFDAADDIYKLQGSSIDNTNELRRFTGQDPIDEPWAYEYQRTKNNEGVKGGNDET